MLVRLDSQELQKELKKLIAETQTRRRARQLILQIQDEQVDEHGQTEDEQYQLKAQLAEAKITAKSASEQIEIIQEQIDSMIDPRPAGRDHHHLGGRRRTCWAARSRSARSCSRSPPPSGEWVLEVEVPDDDMGPVLGRPEQARGRDRGGQEDSPARRSRPTS